MSASSPPADDDHESLTDAERILQRVCEFDDTNVHILQLAKAAKLNPLEDFVGLSLRRLNLRGETFSGFNLAHVDLSGSVLTGCNFSECNLSGADLSWTDCTAADFTSTILSDVATAGANFRDANFRNAKLNHVSFVNAEIDGAKFLGASSNLIRRPISGPRETVPNEIDKLSNSSLQEKIGFISKSISDTDIMSIPGNAFALSELVECLCNKHHHQRPIAIVGAGASAELYPLWQPLLIELGKTAIKRRVITTNTPQWWIEIAETDAPIAAKMITAEVGEAEFRRFVYSQFSTKYTAAGRSFTRAQGEVMLTSYKGFVTTNYDPGLLEARIRLRENPTATGYCTRLNRDKLTEWLDGSLFDKEDWPILYAHGIWDDYQSWVLDIDQYDKAYSDRLYVRVLEKLWMEERLVCIGFSFLDPWVKQMAS